MRNLLLISIACLISFNVSANSILGGVNPFLNAKDREAEIMKEREAEDKRIKEMVDQLVQKVVSGQTDSAGGFKKPSSRVNPEAVAVVNEKAELPTFSVVGLKSDYVLLRKAGNKPIILKHKSMLYEAGEQYVLTIDDYRNVKLTHVMSGKVVFQGGVGSVFEGADSQESTSAGNRR